MQDVTKYTYNQQQNNQTKDKIHKKKKKNNHYDHHQSTEKERKTTSLFSDHKSQGKPNKNDAQLTIKSNTHTNKSHRT